MNVIYENSKVEQYVKKYNIMLRKLDKNEHLVVHKKYYSNTYKNFKVTNRFDIDDIEYYEILYNKYDMKCLVPHPIEDYCSCYEILQDVNNIRKDNIVNEHRNIYGYEIKYWFTINNIEFNDEKYIGFKNKIKHLNDNSKYRIRRNKKLNIYDFIKIS